MLLGAKVGLRQVPPGGQGAAWPAREQLNPRQPGLLRQAGLFPAPGPLLVENAVPQILLGSHATSPKGPFPGSVQHRPHRYRLVHFIVSAVPVML